MAPTTKLPEELFFEKVAWNGDEDECWDWQAAVTEDGYGQFWVKQRQRMVAAHRVAYEWFVGPIPDGLEIDHLCRNRGCVNPSHMEPVSHRENILRGDGWGGKHFRMTHCLRGHELTPENIYVPPNKPTKRECRECRRVRYQAQKEGSDHKPDPSNGGS